MWCSIDGLVIVIARVHGLKKVVDDGQNKIGVIESCDHWYNTDVNLLELMSIRLHRDKIIATIIVVIF
jgi:hypothetical protein